MKFSFDSVGSKSEKELLKKLIDSLNIAEAPKQLKEIELKMYPPIETTMEVKNMHKVWKSENIHKIQSPEKSIRLEPTCLCPIGSILVEVMFIEKYSGGMGSYYGFEGYFLSIIVSSDLLSVLDFRGEPAS